MSPELEGKFSTTSTTWEAQMTQKYLLNKMSLNGSTHKTRLCIDWLRLTGAYPYNTCKRSGSRFTNLALMVTL